MDMPTQDFDAPDPGDTVRVLSRDGVRDEEAHWEREHSRERYYQPGLEYEDYAPAYCVGYIGFAQYGGRFEDAESSLRANWERIKGDSRLTPGAALLAMRAAWDRMAFQAQPRPARVTAPGGLLRRWLGSMAFNLGVKLTR